MAYAIVAVLFLTQSTAFATLTPEALQLLVFRETEAGQRIALRLIGRPIEGPKDLGELRTRLAAAERTELRSELEVRLAQIGREVDVAGEHVVGKLADGYLRFTELDGGRLRFVPSFVAEDVSSSFANNATRFLHPRPLERFEEAFPVGAGSFESSLPKDRSIYQRLLQLEAKYVHRQGALDPQAIAYRLSLRKGDLSLKDITDEVIRIRRELTLELRAIAREYTPLNRPLAETLDKAASELSLDSEALARYAAKTRELSSTAYRPDSNELDNVIRGYSGKIQGELGELRVAVRLPDFVARGPKVRGVSRFFPKNAEGARASRALAELVRNNSRLERKELDLILDQGRAWGEIKTFRDVFSPRHPRYKHVIEQAEMTRDIRDLLATRPEINAVLGGAIELRIYFVGGVREDAARELESLGYHVFGARYER